jgi:hypothetical protein
LSAVTSFADVAQLALMSNSVDLVRAWVGETLGVLATDDDANARLRDTLQVFLQENGSFKATAERLTLHKNTVQYRVRKAEESLCRPIDEKRLHLELALLASQWLSAAVLQRPGDVQPRDRHGTGTEAVLAPGRARPSGQSPRSCAISGSERSGSSKCQ